VIMATKNDDPLLRVGTLPDGSTLKVFAGMHMIAGNRCPHFSITGEIRTPRGRLDSCGCLHSEILSLWPDLADLVAMHLADWPTGRPMYAAQNGAYHLGLTKWEARNNRHVADHFRLTMAQAEALNLTTREQVKAYCDEQAPRWAAEAQLVASRYHLRVYGDRWQPMAADAVAS